MELLNQEHCEHEEREGVADILLVDDTNANLMALEAVLSRLNQNIVKANSGKEALKILLQRDFAVILLDINMPGMDGFETASLIRQRKKSETTPIIFVTAYSGSETHRNMGYSLGAVDYIFAPIVPEILQSKVSVFVELYKKAAQIKHLNERLKVHAKNLEQRVAERTWELSTANKQLKVEIAERLQAEKKLKQANEELIRSNKIKSEFTSMVSHELRTPLAAIKESIELVMDGVDGPVTPDQIATLAISKSNVDRLSKLIQNVLNFTKLEAGKMETYFDKNNMNVLVRETHALLTSIAHKKGVDFTVEIPPDDLYAVCDADQIKQLALNLFDNAIKFTPKHGRVTGRLGTKDQAIVLEVEDSGVGIKKEDSEKIFEMFAQIHQPGVHKTGGVGIGLAICKQIACQHHGELTVKSVPGKGTRFLFSFPSGLNLQS